MHSIKAITLSISCATNTNNFTRNRPKERRRDYPDKDYDSLVTTHAFIRALVTTLAFVEDAGIFGRFLTLCSFGRHQAWFGTEHLKNDIRECRYAGKRTRPDTTIRKALFGRTYQREKAISVPHTFHFMHPATSAFGRFFSRWWDRRRCTIYNLDTIQACVLAQSCQQQRQG
jgi:hypothetical protein